jgi:hypothetical protein
MVWWIWWASEQYIFLGDARNRSEWLGRVSSGEYDKATKLQVKT